MNTDRILALADALENEAIVDVGFNMESFFSFIGDDVSDRGCLTTACIAGSAVALFEGIMSIEDLKVRERKYRERMGTFYLNTHQPKYNPFYVRAMSLLELTHDQADRLFIDYAYGDVKPRHAVDALRRLAETGEVSFDLYEKDVGPPF